MKTMPSIRVSSSGATPACLWMQAGVVRKKDCRRDYHCQGCRFDRAMRRAADKAARARADQNPLPGTAGKIVHWQDRLNEMPQQQQPCIHHMADRIAFRACTNQYRCENCEFDQYFQDQYVVHAVVRPMDVLDVHGFKLPQGFYLHAGHSWVRIEEGGEVRVGLDDFALRLLGPFDSIEPPLLGKEVRQNRSHFVASRQGLRAEILSPVTGVVTAVNPAVRETPGQGSRSSYTDGWMVRVHASDLRSDLKRLMIGADAVDFLDAEIDRLYQVIEEEAGPLAADGGELKEDIYGNLGSVDWHRLTRLFLRT
ncbi:MAG: glycine cleavage system protein H [Desulfobacteraceae bacterium]|nr:glycine cleavage system protein H [Desulfobacteraceae bacterium]